jgi:hypothetical protein
MKSQNKYTFFFGVFLLGLVLGIFEYFKKLDYCLSPQVCFDQRLLSIPIAIFILWFVSRSKWIARIFDCIFHQNPKQVIREDLNQMAHVKTNESYSRETLGRIQYKRLFSKSIKSQENARKIFWWDYSAEYIVGPWVIISLLILMPRVRITGRLVGLLLGIVLTNALYFSWITFDYCLPLSMHQTAMTIGAGFLLLFVFSFAFLPFISHFALMGMLICLVGVTGYFMDTVQFMGWMTLFGPLFLDFLYPWTVQKFGKDKLEI